MNYPRVIAHRCGGRLAAENSLAGLAAAARLGCRGVEFDVMLSADGVAVLMHDDTVERTTGGRGRVDSLTSKQLRELDIGGERVPLLAEALDRCAELGLWANIELKLPEDADAERLGTAIGRMLAERWNGHGVISSFSMTALRAAKSQSPRHAYALLFETLPADWQRLAGELLAVGVHLDAERLGADACRALNAAGLTVACYTVNDRTEAERLLAAGVSAVFTDRPDLWPRDEM